MHHRNLAVGLFVLLATVRGLYVPLAMSHKLAHLTKPGSLFESPPQSDCFDRFDGFDSSLCPKLMDRIHRLAMHCETEGSWRPQKENFHCPDGLAQTSSGVCRALSQPGQNLDQYDDANKSSRCHRTHGTECKALPCKRSDDPDLSDLDASLILARLPDNIPQDFWNRTSPPSQRNTTTQILNFEFLHCSGLWNEEERKVDGNCNYLAGDVARGSEFHLLIKGTKSLVGTCGLSGHMATWNPTNLWTKFPEEQTTLNNSLCVYDLKNEAKYLRITN